MADDAFVQDPDPSSSEIPISLNSGIYIYTSNYRGLNMMVYGLFLNQGILGSLGRFRVQPLGTDSAAS